MGLDLHVNYISDWIIPIPSFGGSPGYTYKPLLYWEDGHIVIQYTRRLFTGYGEQTRSPHIPAITEAQAEALDTLQFVAERLSLALNFRKGDIQYINSLGLLHARDSFRDSPEKTWVPFVIFCFPTFLEHLLIGCRHIFQATPDTSMAPQWRTGMENSWAFAAELEEVVFSQSWPAEIPAPTRGQEKG